MIDSPKWWFAPKATAHLFHDFFPSNRNSRFMLGSPVVIVLLIFIIAALYGLVVVLCASLILIVWVAQIIVLIPVGPIMMVRKVRA